MLGRALIFARRIAATHADDAAVPVEGPTMLGSLDGQIRPRIFKKELFMKGWELTGHLRILLECKRQEYGRILHG